MPPPPRAAAAREQPPKEQVTAVKPRTQVAALPPVKPETEQRARATSLMPIGTWSSSDGAMRIASCGSDLCGYAVGGEHAGKMVLIHMRETSSNHRAGRVVDVRSGQASRRRYR